MARPQQDLNIIYGRHPVVEALENGVPIEKVMLQKGIRGEMEKELRHLCKAAEVPMLVIPKERLKRYTNGNHQGVVALQALIRYQKIEDILPVVFERSETPLFVLLDGVTDVRNFGAIARTAEVCGAHALVITQKNSAQINPEAMKTSAGALNTIPVCREKSLITVIDYLQQSGVQVLASDLQAGEAIYDLDLTAPVAFVLGAEGEGISSAVARKADQTFIIPQLGQTDSLNVSVAGGMMLYEAMRQRK